VNTVITLWRFPSGAMLQDTSRHEWTSPPQPARRIDSTGMYSTVSNKSSSSIRFRLQGRGRTVSMPQKNRNRTIQLQGSKASSSRAPCCRDHKSQGRKTETSTKRPRLTRPGALGSSQPFLSDPASSIPRNPLQVGGQLGPPSWLTAVGIS